MNDIVKQLITAIPQYLISFFKLLGSPRELPISQLPKDGNDLKNTIAEALKFSLISYVLIVVLVSLKKDVNLDIKRLSVDALETLVNVSLLVCAIYIAWKIFGSSRRFLDYFIIYSYQFGVILIIITLTEIISDGYVRTFDKALYDSLVKYKNPSDFNPQWLHKSSYQVSLGIIGLGYAIAAIWAWIGWGAYRIINNFKRGKSFLVLMVAGVFSWIAIFISVLIASGLRK
jgi:hypothetical protein